MVVGKECSTVLAVRISGSLLKQLDLSGLQMFRLVLEVKKVGCVAALLGISASTVSRSISRLEAAVGKDLFWRRNNRLVATPDAMLLNAEIEPIFLAIEAIQAHS